MTFDEYQKEASVTAIYDDPVYPILGLCSEAGEVAGKVKKFIRDDGDEKELAADLKKELGDVLWYIAAIATDLGVSLSEIAEINIEKLQSRLSRGVISGSGDNR